MKKYRFTLGVSLMGLLKMEIFKKLNSLKGNTT